MVIVPCCGVCNLGRLAVDAAHLFRDKTHTLMALGSLAAGHGVIDKSVDILAINGCEKICATKVLQEAAHLETWCLTLTDLGLTKCDTGLYDKDDLALVVDALETACVEVGDQVPNLGSCGCC